jgi:hypothetical protein
VKPMLHSQRTAYGRMSRPRRLLHRVLWTVYGWVWDIPVARAAWGLYRRTWPR